MPTELDPLLGCDNHCSPEFVEYLVWDDGTRIATSKATKDGLNWELGLRCQDCGVRFMRHGVSVVSKQQLDRHLLTAKRELQELDDHFNEDEVRKIMEETNG